MPAFAKPLGGLDCFICRSARSWQTGLYDMQISHLRILHKLAMETDSVHS